MANKQIIALIPARGGSKHPPKKNITIFKGLPLIAHSILYAKKCKKVNRVIVSTDSDEIKEISLSYGAEVPFIRPKKFAQDNSTDFEVFYHALKWLKGKENYQPQYIVHLRPTSPLRNQGLIEKGLKLLEIHKKADSVRSVIKNQITPYKMWRIEEGKLKPLLKFSKMKEPYNMSRHLLPVTYWQNGYLDIMRYETIFKKKSMSGRIILPLIMSQNENLDIDSMEDIIKGEMITRKYDLLSLKRFVVDIDGVIATKTIENNYTVAKPILNMIKKVNYLYDKGHEIILFTARGYATGINWKRETEDQLKKWGVKYHELIFGKPHADFYIDDKMMDLQTFREIV